MTSMTTLERSVTGGVDTHGDTHHAAMIDLVGRRLGDQEFPATPAGYQALWTWMESHGTVSKVGVEGTGCYGAALSKVLRSLVQVVEVDRPNRQTRRREGKSDPVDAYAAAKAALNDEATGTPKTRDGAVEMIRMLRISRTSAVKARTQAMNQLKGLLVTAPADLREQLRDLSPTVLITTCARLRPTKATDVEQTTKTVLRRLAVRHQALGQEIKQADADIRAAIETVNPKLLTTAGVGPEVAGQLLVTVGDNPDRIGSEGAFAALTGVSPLQASSGKTSRHRLNRGGDRQANRMLYTVALNRMRYDERTRAYVTKRTAEGKSKKEIIRCLKRYIARELYTTLTATTQPNSPQERS